MISLIIFQKIYRDPAALPTEAVVGVARRVDEFREAGRCYHVDDVVMTLKIADELRLIRQTVTQTSNLYFLRVQFFSAELPPDRDARQLSAPGAENRVVRCECGTHTQPWTQKSSSISWDETRPRRDDPSQTGPRAGARDRDFLTRPVALVLCSSLRIFTQQNNS
jgi:hypothetical protein